MDGGKTFDAEEDVAQLGREGGRLSVEGGC